MDKLQRWLQKWLMPVAEMLERQRHLQAVKDGIVGIVPVIIIGSFCLVPTGIGNMLGGGVLQWVNAHNSVITLPTYFTTNIMSLYAALFIANSLAKSYDIKNVLVGPSAILVHLILSVTISEEGGWVVSYLGAEGLFVAIISGLLVVEVMRLCTKYHLTIKMPESVPPMVADSFSALVPLVIDVAAAVAVASICMAAGSTVFPQVIMNILAPAITSMDSLPAVMLIIFITQLLWVFGLHGAAITSSVWAPFAIANASANAAAVAAGQTPAHVFTFGFYYGFLQVSGSGMTLGLVILMMLSKAKSLRAIGRIGVIPSLFGVNEPIIFGVPLIMNPFLMVPFVFGPVIVAGLNYLAMSTGLVGLPLWESPGFLPPGFQAFLLTLDWKAAVMAVLNVVIMTLFYFPFFKMMEADELKKEQVR
ncbi:MAG: PTS sugar transporter subunit IIC [Hungatella sp.]|jgi:PTS system cellobiose-specific IIC component|nr:PTS sugar transporter subunit IIC [Hungatella sp.]MCI9635983.1 PTS sugar transporter subunit IIC [Hungatella sp.]